MVFQGTKLISTTLLGLSQIYLNRDKIKAVEAWFHPNKLDHFQPLPVRNFGDGNYTLTDGHTRVFVAYKNGVSFLPIVYDHDDIVAGKIGQMLYNADIEWCKRFQLSNIQDLENRILSNDKYQKLWVERCGRSYQLLTRTCEAERKQLQNLVPNLFLYGASEDLSELFLKTQTVRCICIKITFSSWIILYNRALRSSLRYYDENIKGIPPGGLKICKCNF